MQSILTFLLLGFGVPWFIATLVGGLSKNPTLRFRTARVISIALSGLAIVMVVVAVLASPDDDPDRGMWLCFLGFMVGILSLPTWIVTFLLRPKAPQGQSEPGLNRSPS